MIIALRGHIRKSFNNDDLYKLLRKIVKSNPETKIYIHTWNILQSDASWRPMDKIDIQVTPEKIKKYFRGVSKNIVNITIDDDSKIKLHDSKPYKIFWKRYAYGKKVLMDTIKKNERDNDLVLNTRFDVLDNSIALNVFHVKRWVDLKVKQYRENPHQIHFLLPKGGCDNIYIGKTQNISKLVDHVYFNATRFLRQYKMREQIFIGEAENLFGKNNVATSSQAIYLALFFLGGYNKMITNSFTKNYAPYKYWTDRVCKAKMRKNMSYDK